VYTLNRLTTVEKFKYTDGEEESYV